jgi:hypothetical protein
MSDEIFQGKDAPKPIYKRLAFDGVDAISQVFHHYGWRTGEESHELGSALLDLANWLLDHPWAAGLFVWAASAQLLGDPDENLKRLFKEDLASGWYSDERAQKRRTELGQEEQEDRQRQINELLGRAAEIAQEAKMENLAANLQTMLTEVGRGGDIKEG